MAPSDKDTARLQAENLVLKESKELTEKMQNGFDDLKDHIKDSCASRTDLEKMQVDIQVNTGEQIVTCLKDHVKKDHKSIPPAARITNKQLGALITAATAVLTALAVWLS